MSDKKEENMNFEIELMTDEEYKEKSCSKKGGLSEEEIQLCNELLESEYDDIEFKILKKELLEGDNKD